MSPVPLFRRTRTGPGRTGAVKPPIALADRSAQVAAAQAGSKFAGDVFNDIVASTAANEHATFQGTVAAEMENYNTFVASRPAASFDELETERDNMIKRMEVAGQQSTTRIAKRNNKNWLARNKRAVFAQTQTQMEAIRSKQAFATYEAQRENLIAGFKREELADLTGAQVEAGLLDKDFAAAQLENDFAVIGEAEAKIAVANASQIGFNEWQNTGSLTEGLDAIEALEGLTGAQKQNAESDLKTRVSLREAEIERETKAAQTQQIEAISKDINEGNYTGLPAKIDAMVGLTDTQKIEQKARLRKHVEAEAANRLEDSPYLQSNPAVFGRLLSQVRNDPESITNLELYDFVGKGSDDGISLGEYNQLSEIHDSKLAGLETPGQDPLKQDSVDRAQSSIGRVRTFALRGEEDEATRRITEADYQTIQNQLDEFAGKLKIDDPDFSKKIEAETKRLLTPKIEEVTLGFFDKLLRTTVKFGPISFGAGEQSVLARKRMKTLEEEAPEIFDTLTEEEKASILQRFRGGATVQEIVELAG